MKIREFELDKLAECRELQEKCRNAHMPIPPVISWGFEVRDENGKAKERGIGKSNSYTRNAYNIISFNVGCASAARIVATDFADGYVNSKYTMGSISTNNIKRNSNLDTAMLLFLGTGTTETINDYALPTYECSASVVNTIFDSATRKLITTVTGSYINSTGSSINITESALRLEVGPGFYVMLIHDVFDAVSVANGDTINWTYQTEVAYPNPA